MSSSDSNFAQEPDPNEAGLEHLIDRAKSGDRDARESLFKGNLDVLRSFIRRRLGDKLRERETSQDLAQSVCREVLGDLDSFEYRGPASFERWLLSCAENKIRSRSTYWNRERRNVEREERGRLERLASFATPSQHMTTKERLEEVDRAFGQLSADYQQVILLSRVDGLSHEEVAAKMERTVSSTKNLLYRALTQLSAGLS